MTKENINVRVLIEVYRSIQREIHEFVKLMWENVKFFTTLLTMVLTVDISLTQFFIQKSISELRLMFFSISMFLPFLIMLISYIGFLELKRRWMRLSEALTIWGKVGVLLGLHNDISDELKKAGIFPEDRYIFQRFTEQFKRYKSSEEFIKSSVKRMQGKDLIKSRNFYLMISKVYIVFFIIGIILILVKIILFLEIKL